MHAFPGLARHPHFRNDLARGIHNADAGLLDRHVQSRKMAMVRFSFLCLRPHTRTSFPHDPEAQPLTFSYPQVPADDPIFRSNSELANEQYVCLNQKRTKSDVAALPRRANKRHWPCPIGKAAKQWHGLSNRH